MRPEEVIDMYPPMLQIYTWKVEKVFLGKYAMQSEFRSSSDLILEVIRRRLGYAIIDEGIVPFEYPGTFPPSRVDLEDINNFTYYRSGMKGYINVRIDKLEREHIRSTYRKHSNETSYNKFVLQTLRQSIGYNISSTSELYLINRSISSKVEHTSFHPTVREFSSSIDISAPKSIDDMFPPSSTNSVEE